MVGDAIGGANAAAAQEKNIADAMSVQKEVYNQQQRYFDESRQDQMPWLQAGQASLADLVRQMQSGGFDTPYQQFDASQLGNDPGFQFRLAQGQKALERSAAARGGLSSGGFMKGLARYAQDYGSNEFQNAWGRHQSEYAARQAENAGRFGRMSSVAGMGQNAAQSLGNLTQARAGMMGNFANSMGSLYGAKGNAQAAGAQALPQAYGNGVNTMTNMVTTGIGAMAGMGGGGGFLPRQGAGSVAGANGTGLGLGDFGGYNPNRGYG